MGYKSTDSLMRHLRNSGIEISGSSQKRQLINTGYYHGYKGYRFFNQSKNRLPFISYSEINATILYDSKLKSLFYGKIMFIETAMKNVALECILKEANSEDIQVILNKLVSSYNNASASLPVEKKKKLQQNKLNLQGSIQTSLSKAYKADNPIITHFYNHNGYSGVPIWALFEIMTMGDFGFLLSCLTYDVRDKISKRLKINVSCDTERCLIYKYIYALKDLRNAIAHNSVVFDTRFSKIDVNRAMKKCLELEMKLPYVNFKTIVDYVLLMCYYLKLLGVSKTEIKAFVREFEKITEDYSKSVSNNVAAKVIHPDLSKKISALKKYI